MPGSPEHINGTTQTAETAPDFHQTRVWEPSLRRILGAAAVLGVAGSLAIDTSPLSPAYTNNDDSNVAEAHVKPTPKPVPTPEKPKNILKPEAGQDDCTSIRTRPNYIYMGWACLSRGDSYTKIGDGHVDKGWAYSVIKLAVKGKDIYKCGFVRDGILPQRAPRPRSVKHCKNYFQSLVKKGDVFFGNYNCGPIKNGYDPCVDGTYYSPTVSTCPNKKTYENFESDDPSPLNVFGTGQGGFRGVEEKNKRTSVHYRTRYEVPTSKGTVGIVVRAPKWAWGDDRCVSTSHRSGGPLKEK